MYNLFMVIYTAVLFYVLTPGILLSLPPKGSKMLVAATHALLFALIFKCTHKAAWRLSLRLEGFQDNTAAPPAPQAALNPSMLKMAGSLPPLMMPPMMMPKK
jgi:hypothetical protein